jgi:hypothetical protein
MNVAVRRARYAAIATVVICICLPSVGTAKAAADSGLDYSGRTSQGKKVRLLAARDGRLKVMSLRWRTDRCARARGFYGETTEVRFNGAPDARAFELAGRHRVRLGGGYAARVKLAGDGNLSSSRGRWAGTWSARILITLEGRRYDRCRLRPLRWSAKMAYQDLQAIGTFDLASTPGDYVGQGMNHSYRAPGDLITVSPYGDGAASGFLLGVGGWHGSFSSHPRPMKPGRYTDANRFGDSGRPELDFSGNGRGCNETSGEFSVERYVLRRGRIVSVGLTFTQSCDGGPALFGDVDLRMLPPPLTRSSRARNRHAPTGRAHDATYGVHAHSAPRSLRDLLADPVSATAP